MEDLVMRTDQRGMMASCLLVLKQSLTISPVWLRTLCTQADLKLMAIPLPLPLECWE